MVTGIARRIHHVIRDFRLSAFFLVLVLVASAPAHAGTLDILIRTDLAPGTVVSRIVTNAWELDDPKNIYVEETFVSTSDDLLSGNFRIGEWIDAPVGNIAMRIVISNPDGTVVTAREARMAFFGADDAARFVVPSSFSPASPPPAEFWTEWISEEQGAGAIVACGPGFAADGLACNGSFCDDVRLRCKALGAPGSFAGRVGPFDENSGANDGSCSDSGFAVDISCQEGFCGDLTIGCRNVHGGVDLPECYFSPLISEEDADPRVSSFVDTSPANDHYIQAINCYGSNCDDKILTMCPRKFPLVPYVPNALPEPEPLCVVDVPGGSVVIMPCPTAEEPPQGFEEAHLELDREGRMRWLANGLCMVPETFAEEGGRLTSGPCVDAVRWRTDRWGRLRFEEDTELCLGVEGVDRGTRLDEDMPLVFAPCSDAHSWRLAGIDGQNAWAEQTLIISEYVHTPTGDAAIEIHNPTGFTVSGSSHEIHVFEGGSQTIAYEPDAVIIIIGSIPPGGSTIVVRDFGGASGELYSMADQLAGELKFDGDDTVALYRRRDGVFVDVFGQLGADLPSFSDFDVPTEDVTLVRRSSARLGDNDPMDAFVPVQEWIPFAAYEFGDLGTHSVLAATAGSVPDGNPDEPGGPLLVTKGEGEEIALDWSPSCSATDEDYAVYAGALGGAFGAEEPIACSTSGQTRLSLTPASGSRYYLVAPRNADVEGSRGRDSEGNERPQGTSYCLPQPSGGPACP